MRRLSQRNGSSSNDSNVSKDNILTEPTSIPHVSTRRRQRRRHHEDHCHYNDYRSGCSSYRTSLIRHPGTVVRKRANQNNTGARAPFQWRRRVPFSSPNGFRAGPTRTQWPACCRLDDVYGTSLRTLWTDGSYCAARKCGVVAHWSRIEMGKSRVSPAGVRTSTREPAQSPLVANGHYVATAMTLGSDR